jgi:hypothetical protein
MCFIADLRPCAETPEQAQMIVFAAVLASKVETENACPAFVGMVMLHAAQYFAERFAEAEGLEPGETFLGVITNFGIDEYETDPSLVEPVLSVDDKAARFFARRLQDEAAEIANANARAADLAGACIVVAISMFAAFAEQSGTSEDRGMGICATAASRRLLAYETLH